MKIAIMSDSHDNIWNLEAALDLIREEKADAIIHCGDFVASFVLKKLNRADIPVYAVLGNNDGSIFTLCNTAFNLCPNVHLHELVGEVTLNKRRIAFTHMPQIGRALAATRDYDLVCFGHTHIWLQEDQGMCTLLNPGEIMGKNGDPSFAIYNTETRAIDRITFPHQSKG